MASLFSKARIAVLSVAHSILDKTIDMNSPEALRQYCRDLETSCDQLGDSLAEARGGLVGVNREIGRLTAKQTQLNTQIDALLNDDDPNNDHQANSLEAELVGVEEMLNLKKDEVKSAEETVAALNQAYAAIRGKLTLMVQRLNKMASSSTAAQAKENAAEAVRQATKITGSGVEVSVDDVAARIQRRADVADEKLKSAMGIFTTAAEEDTAMATVTARLAQRKRRLTSTNNPPAS